MAYGEAKVPGAGMSICTRDTTARRSLISQLTSIEVNKDRKHVRFDILDLAIYHDIFSKYLMEFNVQNRVNII